MRTLAVLVFTLAVGGATLAGSGLVVAPHVDPPGTPRFHDHVLAAYRFALFSIRLADRVAPGPHYTPSAPTTDVAAPLVLALLAIAVPRLRRPARRPIAVPAAGRIVTGQWRAVIPHGPPRVSASARRA